MTSWWNDYTRQAKKSWSLVTTHDDSNLLTGMLSAKLGLPMPDLRSDQEKEKNLEEPLTSLSLLAGLESQKNAIYVKTCKVNRVEETSACSYASELA